jgi:hypothetical protein
MRNLASRLNRSIAEREALGRIGWRRTMTRVAHLLLAAAKLVRWRASTLERAAVVSHERTSPTPTHVESGTPVRPGSTRAVTELLDGLAMVLSNETLDTDDTSVAWHLSRLVNQTLECRDEIIRDAQAS